MTENVTTSTKKFITPRSVVVFAVGHATRFVVASAITAIVPVESKADKVKLYVGAYAIAGMVGKKAQEYVNSEIDDLIEAVDEIKVAVEQHKTDSTP